MSIEKTVYLVRHGQSKDNTAPVFQSYESPLSAEGIAQAHVVGERCKSLSFEIIISSPQHRALRTAQIIGEATGKRIETSELIIERRKPSLIEGLPWEDSHASEVWKQWETSFHESGNPMQDSDNFESLIKRVDKTIDYIQLREEKALLIVSHGIFLKTLLARIMLGNDLSSEQLMSIYPTLLIENTGISVLKQKATPDGKGRWGIWTINDHSHFAE